MANSRISRRMVKAGFKKENIPSYLPCKPLALPMFFEKKPYQGASGRLYPLAFTDGISSDKTDHSYAVATLENEYIGIKVLPQIGGKIQRAYDKTNRYDFIYHNPVIKPAMIGLAGPWCSGGIEFNWPQHHRPTTFMPVEAAIEECANGEKTVWVGETEPFNRTRGMAGITVCPGRSFIKVKVRLYNATPIPQSFMWWANLAVAVNDRYQVVFPPDVEYVNDHDRRAVISWPIAKGVYQTARPYDFAKGTDISRYPAVVVPSSYMVSLGQSNMDFVSGYDFGRDCGVVTVADHGIAPGKKLFHWGNHAFGNNWCANLTDDGSRYIELMTGVYTDNQPDFSWIMPFETKCFEQYWYPISKIGAIKNATIDAAVNLEKRGNRLFLGFNATADYKKCTVRLSEDGQVLFEEQAHVSPGHPYCRELEGIPAKRLDRIVAALLSQEGKTLVAFGGRARETKKPIAPRPPALAPNKIPSVEELYINGLHLEQYRHHTYVAEDYYRDGLRRDPGDIRCNTAMGNSMLRNGCFDQAIAHYDKAIERLTLRNGNPYDTEVFHMRGLALRYLGRTEEAYRSFSRGIWNYAWRSAGYTKLAEIDALRGEYAPALAKLDLAIGTNAQHLRAHILKAAILRHGGDPRQALEISNAQAAQDRLDILPRFELYLAQRAVGRRQKAAREMAAIRERFIGKPEYYLDAAVFYMDAGFYRDALDVLKAAGASYSLVRYYAGYCRALLGDKTQAVKCCQQADRADPTYCFPARLADIAVLENACALHPSGAMAPYYLGCLYYDKTRYEEAIRQWEISARLKPSFAPAHRNLAIAYFDKRGDHPIARRHMEKAFRLAPDNSRLFYELQQLLKNAGVPPDERLALYAHNEALAESRDDCVLDRMILLTMQGEYDAAIEMARRHTFHTYEGGEGKLTRHHAWLHVLKGNRYYDKGEYDKAAAEYMTGTRFPANYGEGKSYFAQEAHIYYRLGLAFEKLGAKPKAHAAFVEACIDKSATTEINLFRALALRKLGRITEANTVLNDMVTAGKKLIDNKTAYPYFGVGSPTPVPFEYEIAKLNTVAGLILKCFGLLGLGRMSEVRKEAHTLKMIDPYNLQLYLLNKTIQMISKDTNYGRGAKVS